MEHQSQPHIDFSQLADQIQTWAKALGFAHVGITDCDLSRYHADFKTWLAEGFHGQMHYMAKHADLRCHPDKLLPNTIRIISLGMDYLPAGTQAVHTLHNDEKAYISRYALGGDYHKFLRKRATLLAKQISQEIGPFGYRAFTDSAPILEKPLAVKAGLGWIGKNTLLMNKEAGSWFFLTELFTDLPLPIHQEEQKEQCGNCRACIQVCPTGAIVAPFQLDARRCISYLTIELRESIPVELRPLIGNRIYGCDDCQLICPWNRFAKATGETQFQPRHQLDEQDLVDLFLWDEATFVAKTLGSAIARIGYECWLRNLAVALGNAPTTVAIIDALQYRKDYPSDLVREHVLWAIARHERKENAREDKMRWRLTEKLNSVYGK